MRTYNHWGRFGFALACSISALLHQNLRANPNVQTFELEKATIEDIQNAMNARALTSVELVNMYLRRIQAYDKTSPISPAQPLNSVAAISPDLLEDAAESDRLRKKGVVLGPLHGIPFLVKWSYSIKGMPITGGVTGWKDLITQKDTWVVEKMRQAGGIVMGHANMDSWANSAASSTSQIAGTVRSAYLAGAFPGGSSGGSGVACGAYLTHFTFGGETGGSIRNPSDRNGLVGYKVSGGSISVDRIIPLSPERDVIGPMTRSAVDNALIRDVVGEIDPKDIWNPVLPILADKRPVPENGFADALQGATLRGKKIGIIGTYIGMQHPNPGAGATTNTTTAQTTTPATLALIQRAKAEMEAAGATVSYVFMPPQVSTTYVRPAGSPVTKLLNTPYSTNVAAYSYRGLIQSVVETPQDTRDTLAAKILATAALPRTTTGGFYISEAVRNAMYTVNSDGAYTDGTAISFGSPEGVEHYQARAEQKNAFEAWMDAEGLDAVVWPMYPNKGPTSGTIIGRDLVNLMYLPGVTVPIGVLEYDAERREPLTMNITGRLYDDKKVLAIAAAYEQATKHRYSPPLAPPLAGEVFDFNRQRKEAGGANGPAEDDSAPVLSIVPAVTHASKGAVKSVTFTGTVKDASGIDRLEVTVGGVVLPAMVDGNRWKAVLSEEGYSALVQSEVSTVDVLVLAVDPAGNASSEMASVKL
ncbi:amidase family protein [Verrucomicrobiota bacterium sgz303538]